MDGTIPIFLAILHLLGFSSVPPPLFGMSVPGFGCGGNPTGDLSGDSRNGLGVGGGVSRFGGCGGPVGFSSIVHIVNELNLLNFGAL